MRQERLKQHFSAIGYQDLDEAALKQLGLNNCRWNLIKKLRSRCFKIYIATTIIAYALVQASNFVCHDVWYEERAIEHFNNSHDASSGSNTAMLIHFLVELALLASFLLELALKSIGYGVLYMRRAQCPLEAVMILLNAGLLAKMLTDSKSSKGWFGVKMLMAVALLIIRFDTLKESMIRLCKFDVKKIHPEGHLASQNDTLTNKSNQLSVVSVREKVIEELRFVQERIEQDAQADVALEYCIRMIVAN